MAPASPRPGGIAPVESLKYYSTIKSKGETICSGASGIVERLPSGDVVKLPWPGSRAAACRRDMTSESQIYGKLGPHSRLVRIINWNPEECSLTMEYMPNGSLKEYILAHNDKIPLQQRLQWALEAAEGLQLLHSANIVHCDVEPKNFLLDADLSLKIADFGGSSFQGSRASVCANTRFLPPDFDPYNTPQIQDDLYGLGSTIFSIINGHYPFQDLPSNEVEKLYRADEFPDVTGIPCGDVIEGCWYRKFLSAQEIHDLIQVEIASHRS